MEFHQAKKEKERETDKMMFLRKIEKRENGCWWVVELLLVLEQVEDQEQM